MAVHISTFDMGTFYVAFEQLRARTASFGIDPDGLPLRHHQSLMIRRLVALPLILESRR